MPESSSLDAGLVTLDLRQLPWIRRLPADYANAFDQLAPFYAGDPRSPEARRDSVARTLSYTRDRARLVDILRRQQATRGAPPESRAAVERLLDERCVAVLTGQQAGAAGGPLFTLLKALTALRLAESFERDHGTPAVAVFWIDSEDHDWNEVAAVTVLDTDGAPRTVRLGTPPGANHVPVARVELGEQVTDFVASLRAALPPTEFTDDLIATVRKAYRPGIGMAEAFGRLLEQVLGARGLILYDCSDPAAKPLVASIFTEELSEPGRTFQLAAEAGAALDARGYHAQVAPHPDGVALFYLGEERQAIRLDGSAFLVGSTRFPMADLVKEARAAPQRFSPNVLLRPIVQDAVFPTVAYVGGPSELAYLGQLKPVYARFRIPMPLIVPRATATILDSAAARFVTRYKIGLPQFQRQDEAELNRLLEALLPAHVEVSLQDAQRTLDNRMGAVIPAVSTVDPTLEGAARSAWGRMAHELKTLHSKVIHAAKKKDETLRRQFVRTRSLVFPDGHPQERTIGFVWFLNRYGPALVDILHRDLPQDGSVHALLTP